MGDGTTESRPLPVAVVGLGEAIHIDVGRWHACAVKTDGTAWCWGRNAMGQVDDSKTDRPTPVQVGAVASASAVATAGRFSCALRNAGDIVCWGERPIAPTGPTEAVGLAVSDGHGCFRKADGSVWCLGNNSNGGFGNGTVGGSSLIPVASMMTDATALDVGAFHTVALRQDGTVWWWGYDAVLGKTGVPSQVGSIQGAVGLSAGQQHSCVVTQPGALWCWGIGSNGRLGQGSDQNAGTPVMIPLADVTQVSAGQRHTCAVVKNGPIHCWGYNDTGQLGNGTRVESLRPAAVHLGCP